MSGIAMFARKKKASEEQAPPKAADESPQRKVSIGGDSFGFAGDWEGANEGFGFGGGQDWMGTDFAAPAEEPEGEQAPPSFLFSKKKEASNNGGQQPFVPAAPRNDYSTPTDKDCSTAPTGQNKEDALNFESIIPASTKVNNNPHLNKDTVDAFMMPPPPVTPQLNQGSRRVSDNGVSTGTRASTINNPLEEAFDGVAPHVESPPVTTTREQTSLVTPGHSPTKLLAELPQERSQESPSPVLIDEFDEKYRQILTKQQDFDDNVKSYNEKLLELSCLLSAESGKLLTAEDSLLDMLDEVDQALGLADKKIASIA